jgi:hypothetical protein
MEVEEAHLPKHGLIPICQNQSWTIETLVLKWVITEGLDPEYWGLWISSFEHIETNSLCLNCV